MNVSGPAQVQPLRIERVELLLVAGIGKRYSADSIAGIPVQWQRFVPYLDSLPARVGTETYGVCANGDGAGTFEYVCGVQLRDFDGVPADWTCVRIADESYAVFEHRGHISAIRTTNVAIWNQWLPASGYEAAAAPDFERYGKEFDPRTGVGGVEIWIPIKM